MKTVRLYDIVYHGNVLGTIKAYSKKAALRIARSPEHFGGLMGRLTAIDRGLASGPITRYRYRRNPLCVKGRKVKGGRAVTVKNFTGTVIRKSDGTVQIVGRGGR